jgi:drug/metabolite transporter (DMT)-like permease
MTSAPPQFGRHHMTAAFAAMVMVGVAWGANLPVTKVMLRHFDLVPLISMRTGVAALSLALLTLVVEGRSALRIDIGVPRFLGLGLMMASFFGCYALGIYWSNPITAAAAQVAGPLVAAATVRVMTGHRFDPGFGTALALTVLGGLILAAGSIADSAHVTFGGGEIIVLLSNALWTVYSLKAQSWFTGASQLHRTYVASSSAFCWLAVATAVFIASGLAHSPFGVSDPFVWAQFLAVAVFANGLGNYFWNIGANRMGVAIASLWVNLMPFFAVLWAMLYGFIPNLFQIVGGLVALGGVVYMQWRKLQVTTSK